MLIELFCLENQIEFEPTGSMTQEREGEVSLEADESYCFGTSKSIPDLAIEVVLTSGGLEKLQGTVGVEQPDTMRLRKTSLNQLELLPVRTG